MIDGKLINTYIEANKKRKPIQCEVDQQDWEDALDGYLECFSNAIDDKTTTEEYWNLIYFSAMAFCKGLEYGLVKTGHKKESSYPRH